MGKKVHHLHNNILRVAVDKYRPCSFALLLTRGVKHDQGSRMFLQEAVKGLIGQVEDRRVRLWPGDFRGLRLGGLRTKTGRGEQQGQQRWDWKAETVQLMCNLCKEKFNIIRHSCSPHSTQYVTEAHTHTHTHLDKSSPTFVGVVEHAAPVPRTSGCGYSINTHCYTRPFSAALPHRYTLWPEPVHWSQWGWYI